MKDWYRHGGFIQFMLGNTMRSAGLAERMSFVILWLLFAIAVVALIFGLGITFAVLWFAISFALVIIFIAEWVDRK